MMIKIQHLLSIIFLLFSTEIVSANISLGFNSPVQTAQSLDINIAISGLGSSVGPSISTYDLDIMFDSSHFSFSSAVLGSELDLFDFGLNGSDVSVTEEGVLNIYEVSFDIVDDLNAFQIDSFTLATLTFDILKSDSSELSFVINDLGDADANLLSAILISETVTTVPVPAAFWLMLSGLVGMFGRNTFRGTGRK